jgi:hypothetical protein
MPVGDDTWYHVDGGVLTHNLPAWQVSFSLLSIDPHNTQNDRAVYAPLYICHDKTYNWLQRSRRV